jgi:hypothetical protein
LKIGRNSDLNRVAPNDFGVGPRARAARVTSCPPPRRTSLYTHAEVGLRPVVCAPRSLVPVRDVCGSTAKPRGAYTPATPRRPRATIGQRPSHAAAHTPPYPGHTATLPRPYHDGIALVRSEALPTALCSPIKAEVPFHAHEHRAAAVRHRCRLGELPASCVHDAV